MKKEIEIINSLKIVKTDFTGILDKVYTYLDEESVCALQYLGFRMDYFDDNEFFCDEGAFIDLAPAAMQFYGAWDRESNKFEHIKDLIKQAIFKDKNKYLNGENKMKVMNVEPMELLNELLKEEKPENTVFAQHDLMLDFISEHEEEFIEHLSDTVKFLNECEYFNVLPYAEKMRDEFANLVEKRKEFNARISEHMEKSKLPKEGHDL
ncbi:hypothetical protein SAMN04487895_10380 [Paenibacillus sophorae]|uniref:DUF4303 domain-containing protein n=1 Tax=Paenibacillus sophorae TaxID=1333845 RepID=A0A1H8JNV7_9BACL|nr:hypothetical protein [Paenibacillus sophorae]QWU13415.1 hypothetical protein KP014_15555 [Paenibacillus sophorae]SEN81878.1 hypothetical protein SAMN04487895_10380 [Paenibacillus sophorae]